MKKNNIIKNALLSVYDKSDIVKLAKNLILRNINIFSTGGTYKILKNSGIHCTEISDYTEFPEILHGKIKTLHPKVHGGILAKEKIDEKIIKQYKLINIDMVIVNFYPFQDFVENNNFTLDNAIEYIDIGGPAMVRSAAKNYKHVVVVVKISDYQSIIEEMDNHQNTCTMEKKFNLAISAFDYTAKYDHAIMKYFILSKKKLFTQKIKNIFPKNLNICFTKKQNLRYGENQHQKSALYITSNLSNGCISNAKQIQGRLLSYNNILDAEIALECVKEFIEPSCVIVKHGNPCCVATKNNILEAYLCAYNSDRLSAFGGVIAFNRILDQKTIQEIVDNHFVEVIVAPNIHEDALKIIFIKKNIRILLSGNWKKNINTLEYKSIKGGLLVQEIDYDNNNIDNWNIVTIRQPNQKELNDAHFAWKIVKYVKSNAIVYVYNHTTISIGAGQMSRVYATKIANMKAIDTNISTKNAIMASDAFFPFHDSIDIAAESGISCIIQPGGSIRDHEVIEAANQYNISMIFTGCRHFKH
ncbi:MAG TPA: bifunctional phosphoribosylaminoimidazolecarboxamide formyltransferase/IMP cyclohydrolase [Buchnera sp. (in: enterobacteria)]|nr:bifunctional phosphoribosylaminoimidazolecarboxamide formyltransferase/IMP cyclohydrolase [Buchnera sp. (in: enterobacteria)]